MELEDYNKYYIQGSDHYLIPKNEFIELFNEMLSWKNESNKQKKVIASAIDYIKKYNVYFADCYEDKKGNIYSRDVEFVEIIPDDLLKILKGEEK